MDGAAPAAQGTTSHEAAADLERVSSKVRSFPIEAYKPFESLSAKGLKDRLAAQRVSVHGCVEKSDFLERLKEAAPSSDTQCVICMEDYEEGDSLRWA